MARKKLEASIKQLSETVKFNEIDLEEKFVQQEKEYVLRSNQTQREMDSKSNKKNVSVLPYLNSPFKAYIENGTNDVTIFIIFGHFWVRATL